jgi:hypothetical protein
MRSRVQSPVYRWVPYLSAAVLAASLSGCRFGNYVADQKTSAATADPISGYYETEASALAFCAVGTATNCVSAALTEIPSLVKAVVTNPVILYLTDASTGEGYLVASDGSDYSLPTSFSSTSLISYSGSTSADTLWDDAACTTSIHIEESGSISKTASASETSTGLPLSGSVSLTLSFIQSFDGDCSPSLTAMKACLEDPAQCGGATSEEDAQYQEAVQNFFAPYVNSGAMTAADIPTLSSIAYEVTFD